MGHQPKLQIIDLEMEAESKIRKMAGEAVRKTIIEARKDRLTMAIQHQLHKVMGRRLPVTRHLRPKRLQRAMEHRHHKQPLVMGRQPQMAMGLRPHRAMVHPIMTTVCQLMARKSKKKNNMNN